MTESRPWMAFIWMLGAVASFVTMAIAGREVQTEMNTFELMFYRSLIGWAIVCVIVSLTGIGFRQIRTRHPAIHVKRNLFHFTGQNLWFFSVTLIPLAQLVALEMTNPIWVALLAPLFLGERMTRIRIQAAVLGFTGILVIAQPGISPVGIGHATALLSAIGFAFNTIYTKQIMRHDNVICVLFWMTLSQTIMGLILSIPGGIPWPSSQLVPWVIVIGITGMSAHYCLTSALRFAPATIVAPMEFTRLPFMAFAGLLVYGERLELAVFAGALLIIIGNLRNIRAERTETLP